LKLSKTLRACCWDTWSWSQNKTCKKHKSFQSSCDTICIHQKRHIVICK